MNPFEALRVIGSVTLIVFSLFVSTRVSDGIVAYDAALRGKMLTRRKKLMYGFSFLGFMYLLHSMIALGTPDVRAVSDPISMTSNLIMIVILAMMNMTVGYFFFGWSELYYIITTRPLVPTDNETKLEAVRISREMGHFITNVFALFLGNLELMLHDPNITDETKEGIRLLVKQVEKANEEMKKLHLEARALMETI